MSRAGVDLVGRARVRLMLDHPYLASAVARFQFVEVEDDAACPVMATDGYRVFYNLRGLARYGEQDVLFIVAHEVLHNVLGHIERRGARIRRLWNIAVDHATNLLLTGFGMTAPQDALRDPAFLSMAAEQIYKRLYQQVEEQGASGPGGTNRTGDGPEQPQEVGDSQPGSSQGGGDPYDRHLEESDHPIWRIPAEELPTPLEMDRLRRDLQQELVRRCQGHRPSNLGVEIEASRDAEIPWQRLLARFLSVIHRKDYRLFPCNRKHLWRGLCLPSFGVPGTRHLVVAVDTSASMTASTIARILGEIEALRSGAACKLTVIQCDAAIHRIEEFDDLEQPVWTGGGGRRWRIGGRGGTDFRPVFDWIASHASDVTELPEALIYCTDGWGTFPDEPPPYPVIWLMTSGCKSVPFGEILQIPRRDDTAYTSVASSKQSLRKRRTGRTGPTRTGAATP